MSAGLGPSPLRAWPPVANALDLVSIKVKSGWEVAGCQAGSLRGIDATVPSVDLHWGCFCCHGDDDWDQGSGIWILQDLPVGTFVVSWENPTGEANVLLSCVREVTSAVCWRWWRAATALCWARSR